MGRSKKYIKIGCCGFRSSQAEYTQLLHTVEIQHTFYNPPQVATLKRWRKEAPIGFEFTLKAWQLITHESRSPTYKRLRRKLTEQEKLEAGSFKPTAIVREAWEVTLACAQALKARQVLFQCPASFTPTKQNISNLEKFFSSINRHKLEFCWEPRGNWEKEIVESLCKSLDLWHVVDPFVATTVTPAKCYFRLHGRKGWRYRYEDVELEELMGLLPRRGRSYVFFNNVYMVEDAQRFQVIVNNAFTKL
jgi:uncharacterized protein YecE (DUF72 family)